MLYILSIKGVLCTAFTSQNMFSFLSHSNTKVGKVRQKHSKTQKCLFSSEVSLGKEHSCGAKEGVRDCR